MPPVITFPDRYVAVGGLPLSTPAWEVTNLQVLLSDSPRRGSNLVIPGQSGSRPRRRRAAETTRTLFLYVFGDKDIEGTTYVDPEVGLLTNIQALRSITGELLTNDSVLTCDLYLNGTVLSGDVQVTGFEVGEDRLNPHTVAATLDLVLLQGSLT